MERKVHKLNLKT